MFPDIGAILEHNRYHLERENKAMNRIMARQQAAFDSHNFFHQILRLHTADVRAPLFPPMLTSRIESPVTSPATKPFTFPGIFRRRNRPDPSLWLAHSAYDALRISVGSLSNGFNRVGDPWSATTKCDLVCPWINSNDFEQVLTPVTITFNPQS